MADRRSLLLCTLIAAGAPRSALALPWTTSLHQLRQEEHRPLGDRHQVIFALAQTRDRFVWAGGAEGLARFDGVAWRRWSGAEAERVLPSRRVLTLFARRDGGLLIGTDAGAAQLKDGVFSPVAGLQGLHVHTFFEAPDGTVWAGTYDGAFRAPPGSALAFSHAPVVGRASVGGFFLDRSGRLLIATLGAGAYAVEGAAARRLGGPEAAKLTVRAIVAHRDGHALLVTERGLYVLEGDQLTALDVGHRFDTLNGAIVDRDGTTWLWSVNDGLVRLRGERVDVDTSGWTSEALTQVMEDLDGDVWVSSQTGAVRRLRGGLVRPLGPADGLPAALTAGLARAQDGGVWIGYMDGELRRLGPARDRDGAPEIHRVPRVRADVSPLSADALVEEGDRLWIGTAHGLFQRHGERDERVLDTKIFELAPLPGGVVAATASGVYSGGATSMSPRPDVPRIEISQVTSTHDGRAFVQYGHEGVVELGTSTRRYTTADGLPTMTTNVLCAVGDDVWLAPSGHGGGGLVLLREGHAVRLDARQGVPGAEIRTMVASADSLWTCTDGVVTRLPLAELDAAARGEGAVHALRYDARAGLPDDRCGLGGGAAAVDGAGHVWIVFDQTVVELDPARPPPQIAAPAVVIEEVVIDGQPLPLGAELAPRERGHRIELRFTAPLHAEPARLGFRYRLEGIDRDWQRADERRVATYTDPPPGVFPFEVEALLDDAPTGQRSTMRLTLPPRWYETWWFRVLVGLAGLAALLGVVRLRERVLHTRAAVLEREVAERTAALSARTTELGGVLDALKAAQVDLVRAEQLASTATLVRGIAHELNNPLGQLSANIEPLRRYAAFLVKAAEGLGARFAGPADELAALTHLTPKKDLGFVARDLELITADMSGATERARLIIGDLQHLGASSHRPIEDVDVARAVDHVVRLFEARLPAGVTLRGEAPAGLRTRARAGELDQLLINLIDNARRAMKAAGAITISAHASAPGLELVVRDEGEGMSEEIRARATQAFFTTRAPGEGSGLGLSVVSAIVQHHGGSLAIASAPGEGTTVTVQLGEAREG